MDIWEALSQECREELVRVEQDGLVDTVEIYLRKHRFCAECKSKVMRAYHLLTGEEDCNKEKGYCPALYEGLRSCSGKFRLRVGDLLRARLPVKQSHNYFMYYHQF